MRKSDIIHEIANTADISARDADNALAATLEHMTNALARNETVQLLGLGSFVVKGRAERTGRNPKTGEVMTIAARNQVQFKPGKHLKEEVNNVLS